MMNFFKKNKLYFLIIILVLFFIYHQWFFSLDIFSRGDWSFLYDESIKNSFLLDNTWLSNSLGQLNIGLPLYFIYKFLWYILSFLGYNLVLRLTIFIPVVFISFLSSFLLAKKILGKILPAILVSAIVFYFNTYFLTLQTGHLTLAAAFSLAPLAILFFIKTLEEKRITTAVVTGLICFIGSAYEVRAFYIIAGVLFFYYLYYTFIIDKISLKNILKNSLFAAIPILIALILNLYWIIPLLNAEVIQNSDIFNRGLFGSGFMNILSSLAMFHPFWTGERTAEFIVQPIPIYFWLIPIFAFLGLFLNRKNKNILFFGIIALLGIFLSKQAGEPFSGVYSWLFENFPGFNVFREASKFYFLTMLGYSILIGSFIAWLWQNWHKQKWQVWGRYFLLLLISLIFLWNAKPIITGEIGSMFVARHIPHDYLVLKDFILSQPEFFRTFWTPADSRWGIYTNQKPKINNATITGAEWKEYTSLKSFYDYWPENERIMEIFTIKGSSELFDNSAIKYVIVPVRDLANDDDFYIYYGGKENPNIRDWYILELDKIEWLEKIDIGAKDLVIYENKNYKPHLYQTSERESINKNIPFETSDFQFISPTEYKITLKNIKQPVYLNFSEAYNQNWKLRAGDFSWYQVLTNKNYFLADDYHFKNEANLNSFYLNPEFIKNNFPREFKENLDGSIDLDLTLYFRPQSYFYLGVIISGVALVVCAGLLIYFWIKQRKREKNEKTV